MRRTATLLSLLLAARFAAYAEAPGEGAGREDPLRVELTLADGSVLMGSPNIETIPAHSEYARMDLALKLVDTIDFQGSNKVAITFFNDDRLDAAFDAQQVKFELETIFGKAAIPWEHVSRLSVIAGGLGDLDDGLILYYSFDKDEEAIVSDESGSGNHAKIHGGQWVKRGENGAFLFDGIDDSIEIPALSSTDWSISAWILMSAEIGKHLRGAVCFGDDDGRDQEEVICIQPQMQYLRYKSGPGGKYETLDRISLSNKAEQWHHYVVVKDGSELSIYEDGSRVAERKDPDIQGWNPLAYPFRSLGRQEYIDNVGHKNHYFPGAIDEVRIYSRAVSERKARSLYHEGRRHVGK